MLILAIREFSGALSISRSFISNSGTTNLTGVRYSVMDTNQVKLEMGVGWGVGGNSASVPHSVTCARSRVPQYYTAQYSMHELTTPPYTSGPV